MSFNPNAQAICQDCKQLVNDILTNQIPAERWQQRSSAVTSVLETIRHHGGVVDKLISSSGQGCTLCAVIASKVQELDPPAQQAEYHIFIWTHERRESKVHISLGSLVPMLRHYSQRPPSRTLLFQIETSNPLGTSHADAKNTVEAIHSCVSHLPFQNTGSDQAFDQARTWLQQCVNTHVNCTRGSTRLPKRVLELRETNGKLSVSMYITRYEIHPYAALSYSWGKTDRLVLARKSLTWRLLGRIWNWILYVLFFGFLAHLESSEYFIALRKPESTPGNSKAKFKTFRTFSSRNIPMAAFPRTIMDALVIANALGFRYLWIDSLCIIQGDRKDWAHQGKEMTNIYGQASLVISASSMKTTQEGILKEVEYDGIELGIWTGQNLDASAAKVFVTDAPGILDLEKQHLSTRGWVFQETLVSPATLHYTRHGMIWECASVTEVGHTQRTVARPWKKRWRQFIVKNQNPLGIDPRGAIHLPTKAREINKIWYEWVSAYSARELSYDSDKFPAMAGVAKQFAEMFDTSYAAGLWSSCFVNGLLWYRHNKLPSLQRIRGETAPSWSWGSVSGRLEFCDALLVTSVTKGQNLELLSIDVNEEHPGTFGSLSEGSRPSIEVRACIQKVTVDRIYHPLVRNQPHSPCGFNSGFKNMENVWCLLDEWSDSNEQFLECWCMRVASFNRGGREGDCFLLLASNDDGSGYRRIGYAEADAWWDRMKESVQSGLLESPSTKCIRMF